MTTFKIILRMLTFAAFSFFAANAWALPSLIDYAHFTDRRGPTSIPGAGVGDKIQIGAFLDSSDPVGSPTISLQAKQGSTAVTLDPISPNFLGQHHYYKFIDLDPDLTGPWELIPTDSTGTGSSAFTPAIAEPEFLPLVEDITIQGMPLGARVTWTLPNLDGFDVDGLWVGIVEVPSVRQVWGSDVLPLQTTTLDIPAGVLEVGVDYVYAVQLGDLEFGNLENVSRAFAQPFRYTIAGDFNQDGAIDAADYVGWRKNFSDDPTMYDVWRTNFGSSLGPGSGSALPSAEPLSASVPEPTALALAALALVLLVCRRR